MQISTYKSLTFVYHVLFQITGILPYDDSHDAHLLRQPCYLRLGVKSWLFGAYGMLINKLYVTMMLGYGLRIFLTRGVDIEVICEIVTALGFYLRYLLLYLRRWQLFELTSDCRYLWRLFVADDDGDQARIVGAYLKKVYYLGHFFCWNSFGVVTSYVVMSQLVRIPSAEPNGTALRILPFKFYVDVQSEPWYSLVSVMQTIVGYSTTLLLTGIETVAPFLVMMACGYLRVVRRRLAAMTRAGRELPLDQLLVCLEFHQEIMKFCDKIEQYLSSLFTVQILSTVYNMSMVAIAILESDGGVAVFVFMFALNLLQFFTCQWIPQHLLDESEAIAEAAYGATLSHRHCNLRANKMLLMVMLRAGRPVQLSASGVVRLSLETFKTMIVNAFSFFTVLRSFAT